LAYVTVSNPPPGGGPSPAVTFAVYESKTFDLATSDLLYDPSRGKVYASRPAISRTDRNTISQINPDSGTVERSGIRINLTDRIPVGPRNRRSGCVDLAARWIVKEIARCEVEGLGFVHGKRDCRGWAAAGWRIRHRHVSK